MRKGTSSCEDVLFLTLFAVTTHFQNALFLFHSLMLVVSLHGNSCVKEYTWTSRKLCISPCALLPIPPPSKCVAHHVAQAASFYRQEVKSDTSHAGHRTTGWISLEVTSLAGFGLPLAISCSKQGQVWCPDQVSWALSGWGLKWLCRCLTVQECCDTTWSPGLTEIE